VSAQARQNRIAAAWALELGEPLGDGGRVVAVTATDGTQAVLELGEREQLEQELRALLAWNGRGAPTVLRADPALGGILLERVTPGTQPEAAEPGALARLLDELHVAPPDGLPSLREVVRERLDEAARERRAAPRKLAWAHTKLAELEYDAPPALLHGALDELALLVCERRGLCAIAPRYPCSGDPAYDAGFWVHGGRRPGRRARLDAIVAATGLPGERVRDWAAIVGVHGPAPPAARQAFD
jgi:streptomycin 6-kinase